MFDFTITLGAILQTGIIVIGGIVTIVTLRNAVSALNKELDITKEEHSKQFDGIHSKLEKLSDVLVGMARFDERIISLDSRITMHTRKLDELSKGQGYVRGNRSSVDGEY